MPIYKKPGSTEEFELPEDFDIETGVDKNRVKAQAKGYQAFHDVTKDGSSVFAIPDTELDKAFAKGYRPVGTKANTKANEAKYGSVGKVEAAARGVAKTGSFGLSDELAGAVASPIGALQQAREYFGGAKADPNNPDVKAYTTERDMQRARDAQGEDNQQLASGAGSLIAGGVNLGSSAPALLVQGATMGTGTSNESTLKDAAPEAALGGVLNTVLGSAATYAGKAANWGVNKLENYAVKRAGDVGEKFVGNPELITAAQNAPGVNIGLKGEVDQLASDAAIKGEQGLQNLRNQTNARYDDLSVGLADVDGPNFPQFNDTVNALLEDPALLPATRKRVIDGIQQIISQPGQTTGQQANQISRFLTQVGGKKPAFLSTDLERSSAEALRNKAYQARDVFQSELGVISPEIAQSGRIALDAAKKEISTKQFLRSKFGTKGINDKVVLDNTKIVKRAARPGDEIAADMAMTGQNAGIGQELAGIRNKTVAIDKNRTLASELSAINQPATPLDRLIHEIPGVRLAAGTPLNTIQMYNTVNSVFNKPALTAAIKMINGAGRTLSRETILQLAKQHDVDPEQLQQVTKTQNPD